MSYNIISEYLSKTNNKYSHEAKSKPNEDVILVDDQMKLYIVLDGISRPKKEYDIGFFSKNIAQLFANEFHKFIRMNYVQLTNKTEIKLQFSNAFKYANESISKYVEENKSMFVGEELPGCVGIICLILDDYLYYASFGDCMGILIREEQKIIFAQKQTEFVFNYLNLEKNRKHLYDNYVNKFNKYSYSVANGDNDSILNFDFSYLKLENNDIIYLVSDGISDYIQFLKSCFFVNKNLKEIVFESDEQDIILLKTYFDDKSIIKICVLK